tara:strand:+ start:378 stop:659 length:282 start_codon:yes stop_codon:yes gene_type:complete
VYLLRVVERSQLANPKAKIPTVSLPVAEPKCDAALAAVADAFALLEYVYLLRVVVEQQMFDPRAKIPTVELPAADPPNVAALADVADALVQPE